MGQRKNGDENNENEEEITQALPEKEVEETEDLALKIKEMEDKYLRTFADFENYRKRVAKEKEEVSQATSRRLLREILEVKDHLESGLAHSEEATELKAKGLREGVFLTLKQLTNFLDRYGVKEIDPLGEPFDPAFHEAIQQQESAEHQPGTVVQVFQKGYLFQQSLLRPARVVVSSSPQETGKT